MSKKPQTTDEHEHELERAMDWVQSVLADTLSHGEAPGALLHLFGGAQGREVDVVVLHGHVDAQYASEARALIVVRNPQCAVMAMEGHCATIDPRTVQDDPLLRDWFAARERGEPAAVLDLPGDYRFEVLGLWGEARDGTWRERFLRINGPADGPRTFEPYAPAGAVWERVRFRPLYVARAAQQKGVPLSKLRSSAQDYLAHGHRIEEVWRRPDNADDDDPASGLLGNTPPKP